MSSDASGPRPRQVTIGGWLVAISSVMLVATVFDAMARLNTVDTRDALTRVLTTGSASGLGINLSDALGIVRVGLIVAGAAAAVTGILGIFVLQRHAAARVALTIAAVPVVLTAPFSGGFLAILVGGGTALLWSRPARDWFRGVPPSVATSSTPGLAGGAPAQPQPGPPAEPHRSSSPPPPPAPPSPAAWPPPIAGPGGGDESGPPPTPGWGVQPAPREPWPPAYGPVPGPPPARRDVPREVRIACILTWIFSSITAALYLVITVTLLADRGRMLGLLRDNPTVRDTKLSDDQLVATIVTASGLVTLWCLAACLLAFLAWRRQAWAWILLLVSVGVALVVELVGLPYSLLHLVAATVALRMLLTAPTRAWFRGADRPGADRPGAAPPPGWTPPPEWGPPSDQPSDRPSDRPSDQPAGKPPVW